MSYLTFREEFIYIFKWVSFSLGLIVHYPLVGHALLTTFWMHTPDTLDIPVWILKWKSTWVEARDCISQGHSSGNFKMYSRYGKILWCNKRLSTSAETSCVREKCWRKGAHHYRANLHARTQNSWVESDVTKKIFCVGSLISLPHTTETTSLCCHPLNSSLASLASNSPPISTLI